VQGGTTPLAGACPSAKARVELAHHCPGGQGMQVVELE
jgi:hypothetical protein